MSELISHSDLVNAKTDADTLADLMTGAASPGTVTNRVGNTLYTYAKIQALGTDAAADALTAANDAMQSAASAGSDLWSRPVSSIVASEPSSPSIGDRVLLDGSSATHPNQVAEYFSGGWHYSGAPKDGQIIYVSSVKYWKQFDGSRWNAIPSGRRWTPRQFGAVMDGVTDDATALQAFFAAVMTGEIAGALEGGPIAIGAPISVVTGDHIDLIADYRSPIIPLTTMDTLLAIEPSGGPVDGEVVAQRAIMRGLRLSNAFDDDGVPLATNGFRFANSLGCVFDSFITDKFPGIHLELNNAWNSSLLNPRIQGIDSAHQKFWGTKGIYAWRCNQFYMRNAYVTGMGNGNTAATGGPAIGAHIASGYNQTLIGNQFDRTGTQLRISDGANDVVVINHDGESCTTANGNSHIDAIQLDTVDNVRFIGGTLNHGSSNYGDFGDNSLNVDIHCFDLIASTRISIDHMKINGGGVPSGSGKNCYTAYINDTDSNIEFGANCRGSALIEITLGYRFGGAGSSYVKIPKKIISVPAGAIEIAQAGNTSPTARAYTAFNSGLERIGSIAIADPVTGSPDDRRMQTFYMTLGDIGLSNLKDQNGLNVVLTAVYYTPGTLSGVSRLSTSVRQLKSAVDYSSAPVSTQTQSLACGSTTAEVKRGTLFVGTLDPDAFGLSVAVARTDPTNDTYGGTFNLVAVELTLQQKSWID